MAYTEFDSTKPDPTTQTPGQAFTSDKTNLLAMRDSILSGVGYFPGWALELQNSNGTTPPTDPSKPGLAVYSRGMERLKMAFTYTNELVTRIVCSYSANSGSSYDVIKGNSTNGYFNLSYDANGYFLSASWS